MKTIKLFSKVRWLVVTCLMLLTCSPQVWGAVYKTYSVSDLTYTSATLTYEKTGLSSNDQKLSKGERKVEVPCSSAAGTLYLSGTGNQSGRHASIWGSNGTSYDATREISMKNGYNSTGIAFTSADIKTENGKYYIIFGAGNSGGDDYKINAFKYVLSSSCSATCSTNATVAAGSNSSVTATTATVSCSSGISSLGSAGCSISSYGFVLGTSANPTISNTKYQVGTTYTTTGTSFSKNLTGLTAGTTYYVRPYATNGNGTGYGTQTSFTTLTQTYTVQFTASPNTYGTVSTSSVTVNEGTTVSSQTNNELTVGSNTITATVTNDENYICRFVNWIWSGHTWPSTVTSDMTIHAVFTRKNIAPEITCSNNTVTISNNGVGTIYYTTNGTDPTSSSTTYSAPFTIEETTTVKAIVISNPTLVQNSDITTEECTYVAPSGNTLQYNANGGTGTMANTTGSGSVTLRTNTYTKSGCSFAGWATSQDNANAGTVTYDDGDSYTLSADATLYAVWKVNTPTVSSSEISLNPEKSTTWFTAPSGATLYYTTNGNTPTSSSSLYDDEDGIDVTSSVTIKIIAIRANHISSDVLEVPFYQLHLYCNTGTCTPTAPYIMTGYAYSDMSASGSTGYSFSSWSTTSGSGSFGDASSSLTSYTMTSNGASIYATWVCTSPSFGTNLSTSPVNYAVNASASALTVAATANGGTVTYQWYSNDENNYNTPTELDGETGTSYTPSTADEGTTYYFCVATNTSGGNCTTNSNIAKIVVADTKYTLSYANGGATSGSAPSSPAAGSYTEGTEITVPDNTGNYAKTGTTFRGWTDGTTFYLVGQKFNITSDVTLTAVLDASSEDCTTFTGSSGATSYAATHFTMYDATSNGRIGTTSRWATNQTGCLGSEQYAFNGAKRFLLTFDQAITGITFYAYNNTARTLDYVKTLNSAPTSTTKLSDYSDLSNTITKTGTTGCQEFEVKFASVAAGTYFYFEFSNSVVIDHLCFTPGSSNYTVAFDNQTGFGGTTTLPDTIKGVPTGKKILQPANPTASGYIFGGWYTNAACTSAWTWASSTVTKDTTLYAKWVAKTAPTQYTLSGDTYYCPSGTATLTLNGSQSGISYQLLKGGSAQGDPKAGTGSALEWKVDAAGTYTVKAVENATYSERAMSGSVTVSAAATTAISAQPTTSVSATASVNFTLGSDMVTAGHGLEYQWYSYTSSGGAGEAAVAGAQSATYTTSKSAGTYYYKVKVSGDCGDPVYSNMITVTVKIAPTVYSLSGEPTALCGGTATLTLSGSDDGVTYKLYKGGVDQSDDKVGDGNEIEWTGIDAAGTYTVKTVETSTYAEATMTGSVSISIMTPTSISTQPTTSVTAHDGVNFTLGSNLVGAGEGTLTYQWYSYTSSGGAGEATVGSATTTKTLTTSKSAGTYYYKVEVIGDCGSVKSNMITVTVDNKHYLTYSDNNGSGAPTGGYYAPSASVTLNSTTIPTRSGYVFLGWNTNSSGTGDMYQPGATYTMPATAKTLYAAWGSPCFSFSKGTKGTEPTDGFVMTPSNINSSAFTAGATLTGGTMTNTSGATLGINASYGFVMVKNTRSISVSLGSGAFQAGTVIALEGYTNKNSTAYTYGFSVGGNAAGSPVNESTNAYVAFKQRYVVTAGDGIAGTSSFTLTFNSSATGAQAYLSLIAIGNCLSCTTISPTLTYSATTLYAFGGTPGTATPTLNKDGNTGAVTWTSSNTDAVTVDASGNITAVGAGSATITAELPYDGTHCGGTASCDITVPALVTQTLNVASETAWGTTPALTFTPSDKGMEQVLRLTKNTFTFDSTSTSTKQDGTTKRWMTASFTGSETTKGKYLKMAFKNTQHNLRLGEVVVPIQPISNNGSAQVEIYEGSTLRMTSTAVTGITKGSLTDVHFTFASPYVFAAGSTINVYIYFYGQTTGFRLASPILVNGAVLTDYIYQTSGNWSTEANWNWGKLPLADDNVTLLAPATVNTTTAVAKSVVINTDAPNTGKLTIANNGVLTVDETITAIKSGIAAATAVNDVIIDCSKTSQGALIFEQPSSGLQTKGTVNFYTKSSRVDSKLQWQYVGYPFISGYDYDYGGYYINKYSETQGGWIVMRNQGDRSIAAWDGLAISGDGEGGASMTGTFVPTTGDKEFTLTYTAGKGKGKNLIGNSWTAPIQITSLSASDFGGAKATIYIFNTGRYGEKETSPSGSWVTLPVEAVKAAPGDYDITVIPAFQGFQVKTADTEDKTLTLNYDSHVRPATNTMNKPLSAPARRAHSEISHISLTVESDVARQRVHLFEGADFSEAYDNGWDGDYVGVSGQNAYLYVVSPTLGKLAVDAENSLEGRIVALQSAAEKEYTFTFTGDETGYFLNDLKTENSTLISEGNSYTFTYEQGDDYNRFMISATPFAKTTPTGIEDADWNGNGVQKVIYKDHMYIIRGGRVFDATGAMVK